MEDLKDARVLVTGSDGFIGSHVVEELVRAGANVKAVVLYNSFNSWGWLDTVSADVMKSVEVIAGDIRDPHFMISAAAGCTDVMHLAALIAIPLSYLAPACGAIAVLLAIVISLGIYNNLANVRGYQDSEILSQFLERSLIQPGELGWLSYERVLMLESIGEPRTYEHISGGFQFAGGFPEIYFELLGPFYAWPFLFGAGYIAAALTALIVKGAIQGRYASTFLSLYVLYGFYVMYIGGMLNFVTTPSYWLKIGALAAALVMEWSLARLGMRLVPWSLFRIPGLDWQKRDLPRRPA